MKKLSLVFLVAVLSVIFVACGDSSDSKAKSSENLGESTQKDFIVNCDKCIMTFALGDETIKQLKQEAGEENFYAMADGAQYDMRQTQSYAVANGVEFVYIKDSDLFQSFVIADKKMQIQNYFGYYLYKKGGEIAYFPDISHDEINAYFGITNPKDSQDSHDNLDESAQKDSPKVLQFDADKNLNYRTVPCKEQLDGYSFTAPAVEIFESKTLKEYEIQSDLQGAYREFLAKYMDDKKPFKDLLPTQNLSYEYDDFDRYNVSILVTYEIINPNFVMISVGYENGVEYFGLCQVDSNRTLIEVRELHFSDAF